MLCGEHRLGSNVKTSLNLFPQMIESLHYERADYHV